ncbi:response regulator [Caulobacter endophyticus]|uniref:response regulator n=1 Tax=Caulobacter endophyticus TaxID=2172652 RepID=UPI00240EE482|nr:response regulator [Caulobacter endophyticus]
MGRVLIVDDDELSRQVYGHALSEAGHEVEEAEHGGKAIEKLEIRSFDLVLIDLLMPVREGVETIIEARQRWPTTRIIAMSAGARRLSPGGVLDMALGLGADEALIKPVPSELLTASVERLLGKDARS